MTITLPLIIDIFFRVLTDNAIMKFSQGQRTRSDLIKHPADLVPVCRET